MNTKKWLDENFSDAYVEHEGFGDIKFLSRGMVIDALNQFKPVDEPKQLPNTTEGMSEEEIEKWLRENELSFISNLTSEVNIRNISDIVKIIKDFTSNNQQTEKDIALQKADDEYNDVNSPHYRDNERYSWAVKTINEQFTQPQKADSDKGAEMKCEAGCKALTGGELRHHKDCVHYPESFSKMYDDLLASKPDKEWVRVEDRLPEKHRFVLAVDDDNNSVHECVYEGDDEFCTTLHSNYIEVKFWRELPNPPNI